MTLQTVDYVVIGGGTTGCAVAARLAQAGASVAIVEAGYHVQGDDRVDIPGNFGKTLGDQVLDWRYETVPQPGLGGRKLPLPRGKAVGGTSVINSMTWGRASKEEYDSISERLGNDGWLWEDLLSHFRATETLVVPPPSKKQWALDHGVTYDPDPQFHGRSGPLQRGFVPWLGESHVPFFETLNHLGIPTNPDSCNGNNLGVFTLATSIDPKTSQRCSSAKAFYEPDADRIQLIDGALVLRIILTPSGDGTFAATGIEYEKGGRVQTILARKEIILSAGSYETPKILELSGIGCSKRLKKIGVKPLIDLPGVGENLQDHLLVPTSFEMTPGIVTGDSLSNPDFAAKELEVYKKTGGGQYSSIHSAFSLVPTNQIMSQAKVDNTIEQVAVSNDDGDQRLKRGQKALWELQETWFKDPKQGFFEFMHVPQFSAIAASEPKPDTPYLSILALIMRPFSRGHVHAKSSDPRAPPTIDPAYLSHPADLALLMEAVRYAGKIARTAPLAGMLVAQTEPPVETEKDDEKLTQYIWKNLETAHHPIGTAAMMPRDHGGVVGSDLKVYGCKNLRVADASIIPIHLSAHPQATLYAIGHKAASLILGNHEKVNAKL